MRPMAGNGRRGSTDRARARLGIWQTLAAGLLAASLTTPAYAVDTLMPGTLFTTKASSKGTMVHVVAKPAKTGPLFPLPPTDPGAVTSTLEILDTAGDAGDDVYGLNAGEWKGLGTPAGSKGWKYKGAGTAADPCKVVLIKEKGIKALCKSSGGGITISPPFTGDAGAILSVDTDRYCAAWGGTEVKNDATQIKRKAAPAPNACPMEPTPTATATPTPTATPTACSGTPVTIINPSSGEKDQGPLFVDGGSSFDPCGRPLKYYWTCIYLQHPQQCYDFYRETSNGATSYTFTIVAPGDEILVNLQVCVEDNGSLICGDELPRDYLGTS